MPTLRTLKQVSVLECLGVTLNMTFAEENALDINHALFMVQSK